MADLECLFCKMDRDAERIDGRAYICGTCVQTLLNLSQEQLREAHALAVEQGFEDKAKAIESFLEVTDDKKTTNAQRNMVRARSRRAVRPSRDQIRAQSAGL